MAQPTDSQPEPLIFGGRLLRTGDRVGPYVFERELGWGGMARVLLARAPSGQPVALKVLRANRFETGLSRFRREFHALSRLSHPNIVRVEAYGDLHGHPYIAMEYVDGPDLHTVIRSLRSSPDDQRYARAEDILIQLCRALAAIHRRGLVHRDLKPSNVLLSREGECKLTDFGIVKDLDPTAAPHVSTTLVGTWAYTSPEHIGGLPVDHRSDLYSLGVMVFALLTGKRPFAADSMAGYLEQHRDKPAPRARDVRPGVPAHLDEICARLLEKRPRDRFQSAQEILYRLEASDDPGSEADDNDTWAPPFVGNTQAIEAVEEAVTRLTGGVGAVVRVVGEDGTGKSRLLDVAADRARMLGIPLHHLSFAPGQPPFQAAMQLARELLGEAPEHARGALEHVVAAWADGSALRGDTRYAVYDAVRAALQELLEERPRVLLLDDVGDAPPQELDLLRFLDRSLLGGEELPLLVVETAAPRAEETDTSLDGIPSIEVRIAPLTVQDVTTLVGSLIDDPLAARLLAERLHADTDGNPWLAVEFLRSLLAQHLIVRTETGWRLRVDASEIAEGRLEVPPEIRGMLRNRWMDLPTGTRAVAAVLAVAGQPTGFDALAEVLDADDDEALLDELDVLIGAGIVREHRRGGDASYAIVHRTFSEAVTLELAVEERRRLHLRLGEVLEARALSEPDILSVIGEHYRLGGESGRAYQHLVVAAGRLVERAMVSAAKALIDRADDIVDPAGRDLHHHDWAELRIAHLQARVAVLGNEAAWDAARKASAELLTIADQLGDERAQCKARLELARLCRSSGDLEGARSESELALRLARRLHYRQGVASALHNLAALAWVSGDLSTCDSLTHEGLVVAQGPQLAPERARLLLTHALAQAVRGHVAAAVRHVSEAEALFDELRMQPQRVLALANIAELLTWQAEVEDAHRRASDGVQLATALAFKVGEVVALRARGVAALELERYGDAQSDLLAARRLARTAGLAEEVVASSSYLARLALILGDTVAAAHHGRIALEAAEVRDPEEYRLLVMAHLARAYATSRPDTAQSLLAHVETFRPRLQTARQGQVQLAVAEAWLAMGDRGTALEVAGEVVRDRAMRAFRLLQRRARAILAANTSGETAARHLRISDELTRDITEPVPIKRPRITPPRTDA